MYTTSQNLVFCLMLFNAVAFVHGNAIFKISIEIIKNNVYFNKKIK